LPEDDLYFFPNQKKKILFALFLMSVPLTQTKYQEILGYQMKNEAAD
jgi:hypothetical protein